jgi:four helix bundle protein
MYKFEKLEVYHMALAYTDMIYTLVEKLPRIEESNLKSQIIRAATSIVLNISEGSTSQSDAEQRRFLAMAVRSLIESVACQQLIRKRKYAATEELDKAYEFSQPLFGKLQAMRRSLLKSRTET